MILLRRFVWITASRIVSALLQAISIVLVARAAGIADFGLLTAFMGIVIIFQALADFGIMTYVIRLRAQTPNSPHLAWSLQIYRRLGIALGASLAIVAVTMAMALSQPWWLLIPLGIAGCLERQGDIRLGMAVADGEVWKNSLNLVTRRSITLGLVLVAIRVDIDPVLAFGVASLAASLLSLWLSSTLVSVKKSQQTASWETFKDIFRVSKSFWANSIGVQFRNLDTFLVAAIGGVSVGGYYGAISRSLNPLMMVSSSLAGIILPMAARVKGKTGRDIKMPVLFVTILTSTMYLILAVNAETLVMLLFGDEYLQASGGFRIVLIGLIFASLASLQTAFLQAKGAEKMVGRVAIATSVVSLTGISLGVVVGGVDGAALGLSAAYLLQCILLYIFGRRAIPLLDAQPSSEKGTPRVDSEITGRTNTA